MSEMPELKPCPFCGSRYIKLAETGNPYYWAKCEDCYAETDVPDGWQKDTPAGHKKAKLNAIRAWNTRVAAPQPDAPDRRDLEEIRHLLKTSIEFAEGTRVSIHLTRAKQALAILDRIGGG